MILRKLEGRVPDAAARARFDMIERMCYDILKYDMLMYVYIHVCVYVCVYIYIYIYTCIERER